MNVSQIKNQFSFLTNSPYFFALRTDTYGDSLGTKTTFVSYRFQEQLSILIPTTFHRSVGWDSKSRYDFYEDTPDWFKELRNETERLFDMEQKRYFSLKKLVGRNSIE